MRHSRPIMLLVLIALSLFNAQAEDKPAAPKIEVQPKMRYVNLPDAALAEQKLFIALDGNEYITGILQEQLRSHGYKVVSKEEADVEYHVTGFWEVRGAGKQSVKGKLFELFDQAGTKIDPQKPDYKHQSTDLSQVAASRLATGSFSSAASVTDIVTWLSQATGIAGRFNEMLTGDPRGICVGEQCTKYSSGITVAILSEDKKGGNWWGNGTLLNTERPTLDLIIPVIMEAALKPFFDIRPAIAPSQATAK